MLRRLVGKSGLRPATLAVSLRSCATGTNSSTSATSAQAEANNTPVATVPPPPRRRGRPPKKMSAPAATPPVVAAVAEPIAPPPAPTEVSPTTAASSSSATVAESTASAWAAKRAQEQHITDEFYGMSINATSGDIGGANASLRESSLIYNALTGRLTSEHSPTMMYLQEIGFGINVQRQVIVERADLLNAFAERLRSGAAALPPKWPVLLKRALGMVLSNKTIADPAAAIAHMMQVKLNSIVRSRYASVVSAVGHVAGDATTPHMEAMPDAQENIQLNTEQERVIQVALQGHHVYIGGSAGTGKTVLLRTLSRRLQAQRLRVAMTATTGVAGCHIGGSTFHHAMGVSSRGEFLRRSTMLDYDVIIIDEVSMLPKQLFQEFDRVLREEAGTPDLPFGGVQLILCGDFLQLGCINEDSIIRSPLFERNFVQMRLETQVRQSAYPKFANDLQLMRRGVVPSDLTTTVQQLPPGTMVEAAVNLLPTNKEVLVANEKELARLEGDPLTLIPETGITSLKCETTVTLLLRTNKTFNEAEFAKHVRSLLQSTLDLPRASLLSLYRVYEDGHAMRVVLPSGESVAWREAMKERFLEIAGLLNDYEYGATVTEIVQHGDGLHTPEHEEYLQKLLAKHPIAQPITFKKGCRVLLRANLSSNLVNGSIGTVVDFAECKRENFPSFLRNESIDSCIDRYRVFCSTECGMPIPMVPVVSFHTGETVAIPPWEFSVGGCANTHFYSLGSVSLPLTLAYAFTVHKVQGLTLVGRVHLELSRMWPCEHLLYVAMSRVRNPEQLSMSSFSPNMLVASEDCVAFDVKLKTALAITPDDLRTYPISSWKHCNDTIYHLRRKGSSLRRLLSEFAPNGRRKTVAENDAPAASSPSSAVEASTNGAYVDDLVRSYSSLGMGPTSESPSADGNTSSASTEYVESVHQSVLVARRMRKLVQHAARAERLREKKKATEARAAVAAAAANATTITVI